MKALIQASTLNALMLGNFDQTTTVKEFLHHADTGIGTYTGLDGEAIFEGGVAYRATAEGTVTQMKPEDGVAFGTVAEFDRNVPEHTFSNIESLDQLRKELEPYVKDNQNIFYLLKGQGEFTTMHVRSCFACQKPYPTLSEAASKQREFHYEHVTGSLIAVYCPAYVEGINLPGWHFHFLSGDKSKGGHVLGLSTNNFTFKLNPISEFSLTLPSNPEFSKLNLCEDLSAKTAAVEG